MSVDAQIAKAWGKLTGCGVFESTDPLSPKSSPRMRWFIKGYMARYVPDPAERPWEWVKAFAAAGWVVTIDETLLAITRPETEQGAEVEIAEDSTPEAALEAAIRSWAANE